MHQGSCLIGTHHDAIIAISHDELGLAARTCRREAAAKAGKVMRRRAGRVQMQHRRARRVICADAGALCAAFFLQTRPVSEKSRRRAVGFLGRHTHIVASHSTPHAHTAHRAPVASIDNHRGRGEGRQSHAAEGWQGAHATSMTPP